MANVSSGCAEARSSGEVAGHGHHTCVVPLEGEALALSGAHAVLGGFAAVLEEFLPILEFCERELAKKLIAN